MALFRRRKRVAQKSEATSSSTQEIVRRIEFTVEREWIRSRREPFVEAAPGKVEQPAGEESPPQPPDKSLPAASLETRNRLSEEEP